QINQALGDGTDCHHSVLKPQQARIRRKYGHPHQVDMLKLVTNRPILPALSRTLQAPHYRPHPLPQKLNNQPNIEQNEI
ncbi:hypothetical protein, partial [Aeromonas hydrophila]